MTDCDCGKQPSFKFTKNTTTHARSVRFRHGFCCPKENGQRHGHGAMHISFFSRSKKIGAVAEFKILTRWMIDETEKAWEQKGLSNPCREPLGDSFLHSPKPLHEGHQPVSTECQVIPGGTCYCDSSGLFGANLLDTFRNKGVAAMYEQLEKWMEDRDA